MKEAVISETFNVKPVILLTRQRPVPGCDALMFVLGLVGREAGSERFGEQLLSKILYLNCVTLYAGVAARRDVFLDPCSDPPKNSLANNGLPASCTNIDTGFSTQGDLPDTSGWAQ